MTVLKNPKHLFAEKIFIDNDEDIIFVFDKIKNTESRRILLIVSEHALLTSSEINLKLLARQSAKFGKNVILVTKNELAHKKSNITKIPAVKKIEEVSNEKWTKLEKDMIELKEERDELKKELVSSRKETIEEQPRQQIEEFVPEKTEEKRVLVRKGLDPKLVDIGPFSVCAGGDIAKFQDFKQKSGISKEDIFEKTDNEKLVTKEGEEKRVIDDKPLSIITKQIPLETKKRVLEFNENGIFDVKTNFEEKEQKAEDEISDNSEDFSDQQKPISIPIKKSNTSFTGRDITKTEFGTKSYKSSRFKKNSFGNTSNKKISDTFSFENNTQIRKYILLALGIFVLYIFLAKTFSKATIMIVPASDTIAVSEKITADPNIVSVNLDEKIIPVKKITKTRDGSDSGTATTQTETGDRATGVVDFLNKSAESITLNAGTKITTLTGNLIFTLDDTITIPERISELTASSYENAPITAETYGEKYNINSTDVKVDGYDTITQLSGRIYRPTRGGTTKIATVVSENEVNALKDKLQENIKTLLRNDIKSLLGDEDILIEGLEQTEEIAFEITPEIGSEAERFDISKLEISLTMFIVSQDDLDEIANELIVSNVENNSEYIIDSKQAATIASYNILENDKFELDIAKNAEVDSSINTTNIFQEVKGLSKEEASIVLKANTSIKKFEIKTYPFFVPEFMRKIPDIEEKVVFKVQ